MFNRVNSGQTLFFRASASCSKSLKKFSMQCIQYLGVLRVIWVSVVCNLYKSQTLRSGTIALHYRSRVHICISEGNYRKVSSLGEHSTLGTSPP